MFEKLDSLTKYPSIETLHSLGQKGILTDTLTPSGQNVVNVGVEISVTEKIDGTNTRILLLRLPEELKHKGSVGDDGIFFWDWFLGSRENLVMARGDRIPDPVQGIAQNLSGLAEQLLKHWQKEVNEEPLLFVIYGELYGGNIGQGRKNYSQDGLTGFQVFDMRTMTADDYRKVSGMPREEIAGQRERGVLPGHWLTEPDLLETCVRFRLERVPQLSCDTVIPEDIPAAYEWLRKRVGEETQAAIGTNKPGHPEGVVVRTGDRSSIVKLKFEDYERTLKRR